RLLLLLLKVGADLGDVALGLGAQVGLGVRAKEALVQVEGGLGLPGLSVRLPQVEEQERAGTGLVGDLELLDGLLVLAAVVQIHAALVVLLEARLGGGRDARRRRLLRPGGRGEEEEEE